MRQHLAAIWAVQKTILITNSMNLSCAFLTVRFFFCQIFDKRDLKRLARAKLLQAVGEGEGIIHFIVLKDVQATVQRDLPAVIGDDVAGMDRPGCIEFPAEVYPHGSAGILDFG